MANKVVRIRNPMPGETAPVTFDDVGRTLNVDGSPVGGGGGGSSPIIESPWVTVTNAQILALHDTPVEILPDPGAGKINFVPSVLIEFVYGGVAVYANVGAPNDFDLSLRAAGNALAMAFDSSGLLDNSASQFASITPLPVNGSNGSGRFGLGAPAEAAGALLINNAGANYTGGDPGNSLRLKPFYAVVDLT